MSFDLLALSGRRSLTREQARYALDHLEQEDQFGIVEADPRIEDFVREITGRWPQIDDAPDDEECPWACEFYQSPVGVLSSMSWPFVDDVVPVYIETALRYGLYVYDPQSTKLYAPHRGYSPPAA